MVLDPETTIINFEEFNHRIETMVKVCLRQAVLLDVKPEPNMQVFEKMSLEERRMLHTICGLRKRDQFEAWIMKADVYLKTYHNSQWIERNVAAAILSQDYPELDTNPVSNH